MFMSDFWSVGYTDSIDAGNGLTVKRLSSFGRDGITKLNFEVTGMVDGSQKKENISIDVSGLPSTASIDALIKSEWDKIHG